MNRNNVIRWQRVLIAVPALLLCVAATRFAMRGVDGSTRNAGHLGTENAGVEGIGGVGWGVIGTGNHTGVYGEGHVYGVRAEARRGTGFSGYGLSAVGPTGAQVDGDIAGLTATSADGLAVKGHTFGGTALYGEVGPLGAGHAGYFNGRVRVNGTLTTQAPGAALSVAGYTVTGTGIYGEVTSGSDGHAGYFVGRVAVIGPFNHSGASSMLLDHPLEPATKYLSHSAVQSPDLKNMYDGVVVLGDDGSAVVELPAWFEALNKDFRYQLTCIGEHAPVYVEEEIRENTFRIAGGYRGMKVSWQVTGTRNDRYAEVYRPAVESVKAPHEAGRFLHPELYAQSSALQIGRATAAPGTGKVDLR